MLKTHLLRPVVLASWVLTGCQGHTAVRPEPILAQRPRSQPPPEIDCQSYIPDQFDSPHSKFDFAEIPYSDKDRLDYSGNTIFKQVRKLKATNLRGFTEVEYAVLKRHGRTVARFDSALNELSEVRFGLFAFLGGNTQQLVVEQTANKFWRYWIVNLSPRFEVIYDSGKYDLVFGLSPVDLDHDGTFEIVQALGTFWYVLGDNLSSPRPEIILKYSSSTHRYVPANQQFQPLVLADVRQRIERGEEIKRNASDYPCHPVVFDVTLRYLYAGRKREAWSFFEREFDEKDKREWEVAIKKRLSKDAAYRAIYRTSHR